MTDRHIVAGSGGFISTDGYHLEIGPMIRYAFKLTRKVRPKFAYIGTATGDDARRIASFYHACGNQSIKASHLELFPLPNHKNVEAYVLDQDIIWVGGGSVANLLAVWRVHGLDKLLKRAWQQGIVLTGVSAGAICWSSGGTTDSFGIDLEPVTNAFGFLPYACGVHYDSELQRRPLFQKLIGEQRLPEGYATDDGVNIHFVNTAFTKAISDKPKKFAYHVYRAKDGTVKEDVIKPMLLTDADSRS